MAKNNWFSNLKFESNSESQSSSAKLDPNQFIPWTEKYRPKSVDEISSQEEVVKTLKKSIESKNLPHLLFYGPPGTGKTSTILAIGRELYGDLMKERIMELNASDERGIDVVRTKIKSFSQVATAPSKRAPPYKLIILDEADSMTADAQTALRRTMEVYSKTTRFCLICNYVSRIIEPLASRCAKFRFKALSQETLVDRIKYISEQEGVPFTPEIGETISLIAGGDLRKAITILQSAYTVFGKNLTPAALIEMAGVVPKKVLLQLIENCQSNKFDSLQNTVTDIIAQGYPASQIISQLFDEVLNSTNFQDAQKSKIAEWLAETDKALQDGSDEFLQLLSLTAQIMKEINTNQKN